jgi:hypothetical protein
MFRQPRRDAERNSDWRGRGFFDLGKEKDMSTRRKTTPDTGASGKGKVKKPAIRDLDVKRKAKDVKGGLLRSPDPQEGGE